MGKDYAIYAMSNGAIFVNNHFESTGELGEKVYSMIAGECIFVGGSFRSTDMIEDSNVVEQNIAQFNDLMQAFTDRKNFDKAFVQTSLADDAKWLKNYIVFQHYNSIRNTFVYSFYMNMLTIEVRPGDIVKAGQFIGTSGVLLTQKNQSVYAIVTEEETYDKIKKTSCYFVTDNKYLSESEIIEKTILTSNDYFALNGNAPIDSKEYDYVAPTDNTPSQPSVNNGQTPTVGVNDIWLWPTPSTTRVTSDYGNRTHPITKNTEFHNGIDIGVSSGSQVLAVRDGTVTISKVNGGGVSVGYGNYIEVTHADGMTTLYAHLLERKVNAGDKVKQGQLIALSGNTGSSTGPHLHFSVGKGSTIGNAGVSPWNYYNKDGTSKEKLQYTSGSAEQTTNKVSASFSSALTTQMKKNPQKSSSSGGWTNATQTDVEKYLNPDNYSDGTNKYQFLDLSASAGVSSSDMRSFLNGKGVLSNKEDVYLNAAKKYNVSEVYLAAHSSLETGNGSSKLAKGIMYNDVMVYNVYGIGAVDSDPNGQGAKKAYEMGWTSVEKAIDGGAKWISEQYINNTQYKQNTLYKMRWNPASPGNHQYATDIGWAVKQTTSIKKLYDNFPSAKLNFDITKYA